MRTQYYMLRAIAPKDGDEFIVAEWRSSDKTFRPVTWHNDEDEARASHHRLQHGS